MDELDKALNLDPPRLHILVASPPCTTFTWSRR